MVTGLYNIFNTLWGMQTIWLYSDPHFGETEEESGLVNKPTDAEQVQRINSKVGRKDTIIFLGDIGDPNWLKGIRGYKVLITGNHDTGISNYQRNRFQRSFDADEWLEDEVYQEMKQEYPDHYITVEKFYDFHRPYTKWVATMDNQLCDEVYSGPLTIGPKLILSHEPIEVDGMFNIHGHNHSLTLPTDKDLNVCSMNINYTPINLNQLMKHGLTSKVDSIHRITIDNATARKKR